MGSDEIILLLAIVDITVSGQNGDAKKIALHELTAKIELHHCCLEG